MSPIAEDPADARALPHDPPPGGVVAGPDAAAGSSVVRRTWRAWWRYPAAVGIVGVSMAVAELFYQVFDTTRLSMIFLLAVLVVAVAMGSGPAYLASIAAFFAYNFYLVEPRFTFQGVTAEDLLLLAVFLTVSLMTGRLAGRVRDEAQRAIQRAHTTGVLFQASRELSSTGDEDALRERLTRQIAEAAKGEAVTIFEGRTWTAPAGVVAPANLLRRAPAIADDTAVNDAGWRARELRQDGVVLGVVAWRPEDPEGIGVDEERLINVLVDVGSAAIVRARLAGAQAELAALARTEQLHKALLSSISHDLRTPLAAIIASASSLKEFGDRFDPSVRKDLVETIEEEADRLNRFVSNLLNMTRLESGALAFKGEATTVAEVVDRVRTRLQRRLGGGKRLVTTCDDEAQVFVDPILLEQAIANVAENAVRFSPPGGAVTMDVRRQGEEVIVEVSDEGPGVPEADLTRIFEKFYRSPASSETLQGTGLGLSIARGLVESMGGAVGAQPRRDGRSGLTVAILLKALAT